MAGFTPGFLLGALTGTAFALMTSAKTGKQRQQAATDWVKDTTKDMQKLQDAGKRLQESSARLQTALHENLEPALEGINKSVSHFEFRTAPHIAKIETSLEKINAALPATDKKSTPHVPESTPTNTTTDK